MRTRALVMSGRAWSVTHETIAVAAATADRRRCLHNAGPQLEERNIEIDTSQEKLRKFWKCRDDAFNIHRDLFRAKVGGGIGSDPFIEKEEAQKLSLNTTKRFQKWKDDPHNEFFCELDDLMRLKFFSPMEVTYEVVAKIDDEEEQEDLSKS